MTSGTFHPDARPQLSAHGLARRDAILESMVGAGRARRRRRIATRASAATAPLLALLTLAILRAPSSATSSSPVIANSTNPAPHEELPAPMPIPVSPAPARLAVHIVETNPSLLARCLVSSDAGRGVVYITDRELSDELRRAGHDPGVIRTPTRVILAAAREIEAATR
jgi:hypothetical protein